ncbi:MAG: uracil-xanthine permease [Kiritimatiellae bacterium]|nr:uracil-xanthine permease [Kiritimatiellia bacterium]
MAAFEKLLVAIAEDGIVTPEESKSLSAAIAALRGKLQSADAVYDARTLGLPKMGLLGVQHMFAMFGATILVPILTGLSPSATLLWAGLGTLLFHLVTKRMVPAFLGSSFAYLAGYFALAGMAGTAGFEDCDKARMLQYACLGVASSALLYFVVSGFVKACGVKTVMKFFPPVVTGPIIIGIGLVLAPVAINSCTASWPVALVAIAAVIAFSIFGRGMLKIIPILMGVIFSYVAAVVFGKFGWCDAIDYSGVASATWIGLPVKMENTVFPLLSSPDWGRIMSAILIVFPLAFATIMEHVGDVSAISSTVKRNFFENPGLHRTMLGDGLATCLASLFGAPANTTYGENTGVLSLSKVYDPRVIRIAACLAILVSFCPKFSAFIGTIPPATIGGVSFILYGMISAVGVRNLVESQVDLGKSRNMLIAALILVLTLGISFSKAGAIAFSIGSLKISLSGLAVGALMGIVINAVLPGKDFAFSETAPTIKDADRFGGKKPDEA